MLYRFDHIVHQGGKAYGGKYNNIYTCGDYDRASKLL